MPENRFLQALNGKNDQTVPVWFMRQAGRCLPEYRAIKEKMKTYDMFRTPEVATEVTLQPMKRFDYDAAIVYADILHIPDALGCGLSFVKGDGPKFEHVVRSSEDLKVLEDRFADMEQVQSELAFVGQTLKNVRAELSPSKALIGFCGSPWTVASYVVEGGSTKTFFTTKRLMMEKPDVFHRLMELITETTIPYLQMQVASGAQALQLFESWGGTALSPCQYDEFCRPYVSKILTTLSETTPMIHYVNKSAGILSNVLSIPSKGFGVDWSQPLENVTKHPLLAGRTVQGNLDPLYLYSDKATLSKQVHAVLDQAKKYDGGFIFNVGHGLTPDTPIDAIKHTVDLVHEYHFN